MISKGEFKFDNATYGVILSHTKASTEAVLVNAGTVVSAYKTDITGNYSYANVRAKELVSKLKTGLRQCTSKNGVPTPCELGSMNTHNFTKSKVQYSIMLYRGEVYGAYITSDTFEINLEYTTQFTIPKNIPYIKLTDIETENKEADNDLDSVPVRTVEEIALEKDDVSWLKNKKYYVVNDDETAEKLFTFFDNYNGIIAYDTETTGLKINCFGKINSKYQKDLIKYNEEHPNDKIRADKLVGLIFCVEPNVSYYFAAGHRKFKNLYDDRNSETRKRVVANIKAKYTVGELKDEQGDMARYIRETPDTEWSSDIILMERCRHILETKTLVAHNGTYEYKVGLQYDIDTNIKEDTIIMHQLMYKFRSTTSNRGEPSNLKYLAKVELGVDQWELKDFFPNLKEDKKGTVKGKGNKSRIDFSYMDYAGTQVYAPTDGDVTLQLYYKYKKDMLENHKEMEYIYSVEMIVSLAMGYMEFYGHRLDETKLDSTRARTEADIAVIESKIRQMINYSSAAELNEYSSLTDAMNKLRELERSEENGSAPANVKELIANCNNEIQAHTSSLNNTMHNDTEHPLNLGSPAQVAELFYDKMGCPIVSADGKKTVNKAAQKALLKEKNDDGTLKFPVVQLYADYKKQVTLLQKFFGVLQDYMYPGGFIFSSFGQISTATGRMSCSKPNAQQYPKAITKIVIPREGCVMVDADYSQIEYRVLTALAGNTELAKLFSNPDSDYHTLMASLMYGVDYSSVTGSMRSAAKSFNFGIPYGMGMGSLAILLTGKNTQQTRDEAAEKYEMYFKNQPRTKKFFADIKEMAQVNGYTKTLFNRYRYYSFTEPDGTINNAKRAAALRQAGNAVIQGCERGDTLIQTKEFGIVKVEDVVDKHLHVWAGDKWSEGDILYSGKKQKCIITFSNGQKFICSPIHKFLVRSAKGNERFVECKDLATKQNSKNPHRIVVNREFVNSDWKYSSNEARAKYTSNKSSTAKNVFLDDIGDSFKIGVVLGRLASDGNIVDTENAHVIRQIIAEHEFDVGKTLVDYMKPLGLTYYETGVREGRTENIIQLKAHSKSLVKEVKELDVKNKIHDKIFMDTEMLRGFLRGIFDGDGGISGKTITLTFGTQADFEQMCRQIQKALLFFGIRSRYYKYDYRSKITIKTNDNERFMKLIGFINKEKNEKGNSLECVNDEHIFGRVLIPESVEITDEYIDMYDVCNTDNGYYVADGIITHNTAADIFKISVARNFSYIRRNKLFGKFFIVNMIHDEQLMEVDVQHLNLIRIIADIGHNMQFKLDGFPPLYIGAGVGKAWGYAKGKQAEIHPLLLEQYQKEAEGVPIFREDCSTPVDTHKVLDYFANRVVEFRRQKVINYLVDKANWGNNIHPAIAGLINLQFNYGRGDDAKAYVGPNGEKYTDHEFLFLNLQDFITENNLDVKTEYFTAEQTSNSDEEEDKEYNDGEETGDDIDLSEFEEDMKFRLIDESDKVYGSNINDIIAQFGICVINHAHICGIDVRNIYFKNLDNIINYLMKHQCDESDPEALQVVYLKPGNILQKLPVYVKDINSESLENIYELNE